MHIMKPSLTVVTLCWLCKWLQVLGKGLLAVMPGSSKGSARVITKHDESNHLSGSLLLLKFSKAFSWASSLSQFNIKSVAHMMSAALSIQLLKVY